MASIDDTASYLTGTGSDLDGTRTEGRVLQVDVDGEDPRPTAVPRSLDLAAQWGWRLIIVAAGVVLTGWLLARLRVVLIPLFVAFVLTALLAPLVDLLARRMPRLLATWLSVLTALVVMGGAGYLIQVTMRAQFDDLRRQWDSALDEIEVWLVEGPLGLSEERAASIFDEIGSAVDQARSGFFDDPTSAARLAADIAAGTLLAAVLTFFFLKEGRSMWTWIVDRIRPVRRNMVNAGGFAAFKAIQGWIRGVAVTGAVDGLLIGLALVVLGVPAAVPIAIITFFASFLPIIGATLAGALATAVALVANGPQTAIAVAVIVLIIQQVEGDVLMPLVMSRQVALHPVIILVSLAVGGAIGGIIGALIAVPITAAVTAFFAAARSVAADRLITPSSGSS